MSFLLLYFLLSFDINANQNCQLNCQDRENHKLVQQCVRQYKSYASSSRFSHGQIVNHLESKGKCSFVGNKIYANTQYLTQKVKICIASSCGYDRIKKVDESITSSLPTLKNQPTSSTEQKKAIASPKEKQQSTNTQKTQKTSSITQTPKIKFQPLTCGNDTTCISRDLIRCQAHNESSHAEPFPCKEHYSSLQVFTPVKNTLNFLDNQGGVSSLNNKIKQAMESCNTSHSNAELCCGDSLSCGVGGEPGNKGQYLKTLTNMTQIINSAGGLPEKCNALKNLSRAGTAGVMAFSTNCYTAVDKCHNSCKPYKEVVQNIEDQQIKAKCGLKDQFSKSEISYLFGDEADNYYEFCSEKLKLQNHRESYRSYFAQCTGFKSEATKANQDVGGLQAITEWTQKCENYTKNNNDFSQAQSAFNGDCTNPAHSSNPICVQCRLDPSAQQCVGIHLGANPKQANNSNSSILEDDSNSDNLIDLNSLGTSGAATENPGLAQVDPLAPNANKGLALSGAAGGSGGGLGQDNIQALGADQGGQGGASGGGYNTNILGNASGGGGYTTSSMGYNSSGGYSSRITTDIYDNTPATGIVKGGFDLKEYLPGGKAFKKKSRLPAGYIQLPDGEVIGPKHGNIFQMMHERYAYYDSLGKFWPPHYSKEKIDCIKKSGILNRPPHSNQWTGQNLHKATPIPNPPSCRHFADHDPNKLDPTQIYLKAKTSKQLKRAPQNIARTYKNKSLNEIYTALTKKRQSLTKAQYNALYKLYKTKYSEFKKVKVDNK